MILSMVGMRGKFGETLADFGIPKHEAAHAKL
jgi:hypothetical protein